MSEIKTIPSQIRIAERKAANLHECSINYRVDNDGIKLELFAQFNVRSFEPGSTPNSLRVENCKRRYAEHKVIPRDANNCFGKAYPL